MPGKTNFPPHIQTLLDILKTVDFARKGQILPTLRALEHVYTDRALSAALSEQERKRLLRCLGEAEAALAYEDCDALVTGQPLSAEMRRRIFLRSLKERLRRSQAAARAPA